MARQKNRYIHVESIRQTTDRDRQIDIQIYRQIYRWLDRKIDK